MSLLSAIAGSVIPGLVPGAGGSDPYSSNPRAAGLYLVSEGARRYPLTWWNRTGREVTLGDQVNTYVVGVDGRIGQEESGRLFPISNTRQLNAPSPPIPQPVPTTPIPQPPTAGSPIPKPGSPVPEDDEEKPAGSGGKTLLGLGLLWLIFKGR